MVNSVTNNRNFALDSNSRFGCTLFDNDVLYAVQSFTIPGMNFSNVRLVKNGLTLYKQADSINFDGLTVTLILDSKLTVWRDIVKKAFEMKSVITGNSKDTTGEAWIEIYSSTSEYLFSLRFHSVVLESIGEVPYLTTGSDDELTMDITLNFSTFEIYDKLL